MANAIVPFLSAALTPRESKASLSPVDNRGGWWPLIREGFAGAWQTNTVQQVTDVMRYWAVFRSIAIISSDVAKCRLKLVEQDKDRLWSETSSPAFSPLFRKPNHFQTRIQFFGNWMESKLSRGNTYVLKHRNNRGVVIALTILSPELVTPLVADTGDVFYRLHSDNLAGLLAYGEVMVPASEIIHDRWNTLYHPLVGLSPIYACAMNAMAALKITDNTYRLFANGAKPAGVLEAPGAITEATAARIKAYWDENFIGEKAGKVAVLGDGLKYAPMAMNAVDAQLIEQLKWDDATIFGIFGIPAFMANAGTAPAYNNVEALQQAYYSQALQIHFESIECLFDEELGLMDVKGRIYGAEFDLDGLLRMDTATKVKTAVEGLKGLYKPNEARALFDLPPVDGGDTLYMQQQNYSIEALAKRDAKDDPFASAKPPAPANENVPDGEEDATEDDEGESDTAKAIKAFEGAANA